MGIFSTQRTRTSGPTSPISYLAFPAHSKRPSYGTSNRTKQHKSFQSQSLSSKLQPSTRLPQNLITTAASSHIPNAIPPNSIMAALKPPAAIASAITSSKLPAALLFAANTPGTFTTTLPLGTRTLLSGTTLPLLPTDLLYLASATKLLTTIAALQCVDDGLLTLHDTLPPALLPSLTAKQVLTDAGVLEPVTRPITLAMLLTHTSGLAYDFLTPKLMAWRKENEPPFPEGATRGVEEAFSYPLAFQPGERWMYGTGLDFAGRVVEEVRGKRLRDVMRERIARPLGVEEGGLHFFPVDEGEARAKMVDLNPGDPEGLGLAVLGGDGTVNRRAKGDFGGHGGFLTGEGYAKVLQSLLRNDGQLVSEEMGREMVKDVIGGMGLEDEFMAAMEGPAGDFFRVGTEKGSKVGHGLGGVLTLKDVEGWYGEGTLTWGGGMSFAWFMDRKNGLCGLGALQASLPVDIGLVTELKQVFRKDVYRQYAVWKKGEEETATV
ncbi:beta-lactamase/transpeptidase-like protein [Schizothecium vesticola]|uniref:Beta-lactamase/transpeptidase-like protein n=1 Tax=Schizothecium vesticola TaxID=314040 RepID=A0AA40K9Q7_9PEZI|nr:beta-lactamase/transpeptidase-like protein [Schizothecium vesticola]